MAENATAETTTQNAANMAEQFVENTPLGDTETIMPKPDNSARFKGYMHEVTRTHNRQKEYAYAADAHISVTESAAHIEAAQWALNGDYNRYKQFAEAVSKYQTARLAERV